MVVNDSEHCRLLGRLVRDRVDHIVERWLERVAEELGTDGIGVSELRSAIPDFLQGLAQILVEGRNPREESGGLWADVAREGRTWRASTP